MKLLTPLLLCLCLNSCGLGYIYTHTFTPLVTDLRNTPIGEKTAAEDIKDFDYYIELQWDSNAIGEIAKKYNFKEVYYADLETFSVLGIWSQYHVHIYGR